MRKTLLLATALCLATSAMAQTSVATALPAKSGENSYSEITSKKTNVYWKFTADKDYIATLGVLGASDIPTVSIQDGDNLNEIQGATDVDYNKIYAFQKGKTYIFSLIDAQFEAGFTLKLAETSNVGAGLSEDNPVAIKLGETQIFGNPSYPNNTYDNTNIYTTYKAEESGQLRLTTEQRVTSATVNGEKVTADLEGGKRVFKINTTAGETYQINFNIEIPLFVATSEVVQIKAGSIDAPFNLNKGEFTVPAEAGKYYYTYKPEKKGYINITSDAALTDGQVKIYMNKLNASSDKNAQGASEVGSYNVRTEITSTSQTYYIVVDKKKATTDAESFKFNFEDYQPGETEDNPISVTLDEATTKITMPSAKGTYYYGIDVPANTNKLLVVEANSSLSSASSVSLYKGSSWGAAKMKNGIVKTIANNTSDATYILKVVSEEESPLSFNISYQDIEAGSLETNRKEAIAGENTIDFDDTEYYSFVATKSGKLAVTVADGVTVKFPEEAGGYATNSTYQKGNVFFIEATKGTQYFINVSGVTKGSTFTLAETEFDAGEVSSNPIIMDGDTYTFGDYTANLWLKYKVTKTGIVDLSCDVPFNWNYSLGVAKRISSTSAPISMVDQDAEDNHAYRGIIPVTAGEELYIQVNMPDDVSGKKLTLTQREPEAGEAYSNPVILEKGKTIDISGSSTRAMFIKAKLKKGDNIFRFVGNAEESNFIPMIDCKQEANGITYTGSIAEWESIEVEEDTYINQFRVSASEDRDCYIYINSVQGTPKMLFVDEATDGIANIEATADDKVSIYTIDGAKVNEITGSGVYIIKSNGKTKKIAIKK